MNHRILIAALASCLLTNPLPAFATPPLINYQGCVAVGTTNFNSSPNGLFKFALVNADGTASYWSNTSSIAIPTEPAVAVPEPASDLLPTFGCAALLSFRRPRGPGASH